MQVKSIAECSNSAILSTSINLPIVIKIFVLSIFEWLFHTGFTVNVSIQQKELLARVRKAGFREEYENRNKGRFIRIFPTDDKIRQDRYIQLLQVAYTTFMAGRAPSMHKEIQITYNNKLKVR